MSLDLLGEGFDLHAGGMDLRFPHHENERAQAVALGKRFARHWMHNGFVIDAEGEKMSKSLGNVDNLLDLLDRYDGRAYRLLLLQSHYRSPVLVGAENLEAAENALAGLDAFAARSAAVGATDRADADAGVLDAFSAAMDDDLDTPTATALIFDTVRRANAALDQGDPAARALVAAVREMTTAVGWSCGAPPTCPARCWSGWRPSTPPAPPRTTRPPTPSAPSCRPRAGSSRRPREGRRSDADRQHRL